LSAMPTPEDNTPPVVVDTFPRDGARDIPVDSLVTASFSKRINTSTINANTFSVKRDGTTTNVSGIVLLSPDGKTAIFRSEQSFSPSTKYFVTIDAAVRDDSDNALASIKIWSFTTIKAASIT
ncbi:MAG TPA: Ig-like domain-containing protein, partial [Nitrososphaeraceae archaeon]